MNRRYVGIALLLAMMAIVVWLAGCNRPMSSGPIPKPQTVTPGAALPTPAGMPTSVAGTVIAGATATTMAATTQPGAAEPAAPTATPAPPPQPTLVPTPIPATASGQTSYTVKPGDRLFSIGRQFGVNPFAIAQANRIGPPYTIYPGQVLVIPAGGVGPSPTPGAAPTTHTVVRGETIYSIARRYGRSAAAIINANHLINPNFIFPGQVLNIP
jgi:LysM repeat protein